MEKIEKAKKIILGIVESHALVMSSTEPFVRLSSHGESGMNITCRVWTKSQDYWTVNFDVIEIKVRCCSVVCRDNKVNVACIGSGGTICKCTFKFPS